MPNIMLAPLVWPILQYFIATTIVKINCRRSSGNFLSIWNLDFLLWILTSIVFFDWAFLVMLSYGYSSAPIGINEFEIISNILTSYVMGNCHIIFLMQIFLFFVSLGRSIYKKDFLMFLHKFLLLLSGFVVWFYISAFI
jgi:hypothetical protein